MRVRFWGTRGSIPVALTVADVRDKLVAALRGGVGPRVRRRRRARRLRRRACRFAIGAHLRRPHVVRRDRDRRRRVRGLRHGQRRARRSASTCWRATARRAATYHVFMSHVHWDHIMGFPFFAPAYVPGNRIVIYGCHDVLEQAFRLQQAPPSLPGRLSAAPRRRSSSSGSSPARAHDVAGMTRHAEAAAPRRRLVRLPLRARRQVRWSTRPTPSTSSRTAAETDGFVDFFRDADLVIFDAMYSLAEAISVKADWGHSSNIVGVELCQLARRQAPVLFHHEPAFDDATHRARAGGNAPLRGDHAHRRRRCTVTAAYDGLEIDL